MGAELVWVCPLLLYTTLLYYYTHTLCPALLLLLLLCCARRCTAGGRRVQGRWTRGGVWRGARRSALCGVWRRRVYCCCQSRLERMHMAWQKAAKAAPTGGARPQVRGRNAAKPPNPAQHTLLRLLLPWCADRSWSQP